MIRVIGHRGASGLAPENTIAGFACAHVLVCHAVEMDVQLSRDGRIVVIHDSDVARTTGGMGSVSALTAAELKQLNAGHGEKIPLLEEVIELLSPTGMILQIELKGPGTELVTPEIVKGAGLAGRIRFTSWYHRRVFEAKRLMPAAETGILMSSNPVQPLRLLSDSMADCLHVTQDRLDQRLVDEVHGGGKKIIAMGAIVDIPTIDRVISLGVDEIGSDRPDRVIERLKYFQKYESP